MIVLKIALNIDVEVVILQESFIDNRELSHNAFNFYSLQGERIAIRTITAVRKHLLDKIIVEHETDLINCLYYIFLEI